MHLLKFRKSRKLLEFRKSVHSKRKNLMSIYYVPGIELDAVDTVRKKTQPLP